MPSPVGHVLAGIAVAVAAAPHRPAARPVTPWPTIRTPAAAVCALLAALPDLDLLVAGAHREASHSLLAVLIVFLTAAMAAKQARCPRPGRLALLCGAAYASHLLLDWLGTDNQNPPFGIQLLWPNEGWYISGWDLFRSTERRQVLSTATIAHNLRTLVQEVALLLPVLSAAWFLRARRQR